MIRIILHIILLLVNSTLAITAQSTYTCMNNEIDTLWFDDIRSTTVQDTSFSRTISLADAMGPNQDPTCGNRLQKVKMYIKIDVGEDYIYGDIPWSITYDLKVKVKQSGALNPFFEDTHSFNISQFQPEELWVMDYPNICFFYFSDQLEFEITNLIFSNLTPDIENDFRMHVYYDFEEKFDVDDVSIDLDPVGSGLITDNPVTFTWTPSCECTPNYEFQLLKLENRSGDPSIFTTKIDWYSALTIETQSSDPSITLTLPEGSGYYYWRVRPIGDYYEGGYGNSRNYGAWSDASYWNTIPNTEYYIPPPLLAADYALQYQQFDDTLNWIYSRQFSEAERTLDGKIKMSEEITYANGLQQVRQHQRHLFSQGNIVANHTGIDYSGRPALSTIYAPVTTQNHLGYVSDMAINSGSDFDASHFDTDATSVDPLPIDAGKITDYYDNGPDLTIPSSEGYPYTRTLFYGDGMNRVKESSGVGSPLRLQSVDSLAHTTKYFYSGVADQELIRVFGDEAPNANSVIKMITVDPNKTTTVSYQTKEGQTIATCLSASKNEAYHDPLISRQTFTLQDTISGDISCGDGCLTSSKTIGFGEPTTVDFSYTIAPSMVDAFCELACTTCEYEITFLIKRIDDPFDINYPLVDTLIIPPSICSGSNLTSWMFAHTFDPGTYQIERRIQIGNIDPATIIPPNNPFGYSYLQNQLFDLDQSIQDAVEADLLYDTITALLDSSELDLLYEYLELNHNLQPTDTLFRFSSSCCDFELPIIRCEDCPIENRAYESYYSSVNGTSVFDHLPSGYSAGQFDAMLNEMIDNHGYGEQAICDCWTGITQSWDSIAIQTYNIDGNSTSSDLLHTFLSCTGYKFANLPFATTPHEPYSGSDGGYLSHAFSHFEYDVNNPSPCDTLYCIQGSIGYGPDVISIPCSPDNTIDWTAVQNSNTWTNDHWLEFYSCTQSGTDLPFTGDIAQEVIEFTVEMRDSCLSSCESRHQSYIAALTRYYQDTLGITVDSNATFLDTCQSCIDYNILLCQADQLVEQCQTFCGTMDMLTDADGNPIGVETTSIEDYYKAMYYAFEIEVPSSGACQPKWDSVDGDTIVVSNGLGQLTPGQITFIETTLNTAYHLALLTNNQSALNLALEEIDKYLVNIDIECNIRKLPLKRGGRFYVDPDLCKLMFVYEVDGVKTKLTICESLCEKRDTSIICPPVCIRYFPISIDSVDHIFEPISCAEQTADFANGLLQAQLVECQQSKVSEYEDLYTAICLDPANIQDTFALAYELGYYHYTLYYYDRANNLVQTIAPAGVDETTTSRMQNTTHEYKTQYRYNTLKQLIWQYSPDGGTTEFIYDSKGQLRFSQNAQQRIDSTCAYTKYDYLGRIIDVGKYTFDGLTWEDLHDPVYFDDPDFPQVNDPQLSERVLTVYSDPYPYPLSGGMTQTYLQNRVSYTHTDSDGDLTTKTDQVTTIYSYDVHGNVRTLIQDIMPDVPSPREIRQFRIDYDYDLISNKVVQMNYMEGRADQFFHRYRYDEDNRITQVETSRNKLIWDRDARYTYYDHGPLKRTLLGEDQIQGIDYTYTIQGWLKSINHPTLNESMDPGGDGYGNSVVPKDVFASALTYFENDFVKPSSFFESSHYHNGLDPIRNLYNGNITQWTSNSYVDPVANPDFVHPGWTGRQFRYDELNRLVDSDFSFYENAWYATDEYDSNYSYDANGNILFLNRHAYLENNQTRMDSLMYSYNSITPLDPVNTPLDNQLDSIVDLTYGPNSVSPYDGDLEQRNWYAYDAIGNLVKDTSRTEPKLDISWNLMGKVDRIEKDDGTSLSFSYDSWGNRIKKNYLNDDGESICNYYVKDERGNYLSYYAIKQLLPIERFFVWQKDVVLHGTQTVGIIRDSIVAFGKDINLSLVEYDYINELNEYRVCNRDVGRRQLDLYDHLSSTRITFKDYVTLNGSILSIHENFPFGSLMPSRQLKNTDFHFGFQSQESYTNLKGTDNSFSFKYRIYDSRIGRFFSVDPLIPKFPFYSPYLFDGNKPIARVELEGLEDAKWGTTLYDPNIQNLTSEELRAYHEGQTLGLATGVAVIAAIFGGEFLLPVIGEWGLWLQTQLIKS